MKKAWPIERKMLLRVVRRQLLFEPARTRAREIDQSLIAFDFFLGPAQEIAFSGERSSDGFKALFNFVNETFIPNKVLLYKTRSEQRVEVSICHQGACQMPVQKLDQLMGLLKFVNVDI